MLAQCGAAVQFTLCLSLYGEGTGLYLVAPAQALLACRPLMPSACLLWDGAGCLPLASPCLWGLTAPEGQHDAVSGRE